MVMVFTENSAKVGYIITERCMHACLAYLLQPYWSLKKKTLFAIYYTETLTFPIALLSNECACAIQAVIQPIKL